jgi:hypothetical protein
LQKHLNKCKFVILKNLSAAANRGQRIDVYKSGAGDLKRSGA